MRCAQSCRRPIASCCIARADISYATGIVAAWHGNGLASHPGRFDALASHWCLDEPVAVLLCSDGDGLVPSVCQLVVVAGLKPLTLSTPLDELSASSSALGEGAPARKVSSRRSVRATCRSRQRLLFCLCEGSSEYVGLLDSYTETLTWASWPFTFWAALLPARGQRTAHAFCIYMFCPIFGRLGGHELVL